MQLSDESCEACLPDSPPVTGAEGQQLLQQLPGWQIVDVDGIPRLKRKFEFENFAEALAFTNRVGALAEEENHHPEIVTEWGAATVSWWTHSIGGLHRNDFIMAARASVASHGS